MSPSAVKASATPAAELDPAEADMRARIRGLMEQQAVSPLLEATLEYLEAYAESSWGWLVSASTLIDLGRYDDAKVALKNARKFSGADAKASICYWRCILYKERGELAKAQRHIEKAIALEPGSGSFRVTLGDLLARRGKLKAATKVLKKAIALAVSEEANSDAVDAELEEAYFNLALVRRAQRRYNDALAAAEKALFIDPNYTEAQALKNDLEAVLQGGW